MIMQELLTINYGDPADKLLNVFVLGFYRLILRQGSK